MEITVSNKNRQIEQKPEFQLFLKEMDSSEIAIVQATQGKRIGQMTDNEKTILAAKVVSTGNIRLGYKPKGDSDTTAEIMLFVMDLNKFYGLTEAEVLLALNSGLDGEFLKEGESVFFNSAYFVQWCKRYIESKKMPALKKHDNNKAVAERDTPKPLPSITERREVLNAIIEQHKAILENDIEHEFMFDCGVHYDNLGRLEMFQFSDNELIDIVALVCKEYPKLNDEQLLKKAKHRAWIMYILGLIVPEVEVKPKKHARSTVALSY